MGFLKKALGKPLGSKILKKDPLMKATVGGRSKPVAKVMAPAVRGQPGANVKSRMALRPSGKHGRTP